MSITSEITRLQTIRNFLRTLLSSKGVSGASNHKFANFADDINSITESEEFKTHWSTTGGSVTTGLGGTSTKWIIATRSLNPITGCVLYATIPHVHSLPGEQKLYVYKVNTPASTYTLYNSDLYDYTYSTENEFRILSTIK